MTVLLASGIPADVRGSTALTAEQWAERFDRFDRDEWLTGDRNAMFRRGVRA